jgi:3-methyladenine DNA glycosylase AlkD
VVGVERHIHVHPEQSSFILYFNIINELYHEQLQISIAQALCYNLLMASRHLAQITDELMGLGDPVRAEASAWFFKTGKGQYGEGDVFLGINVPTQRKIARKYVDLSLSDLQAMLDNKIHEFRLVALFILVLKYTKSDEKGKKEIVDFYLKNTKKVNNWDLVDSSAGYIFGEYLHDKDKKILYKLARSENLWERRIAIIATQGFIRRFQFEDTLKISEILINDKHDLIHKAVGWMLREVGNRDLKTLYAFLDKYYQKMPRTMLRYAIEKFEKSKREFYMLKTK